jgi:hypothetical protein
MPVGVNLGVMGRMLVVVCAVLSRVFMTMNLFRSGMGVLMRLFMHMSAGMAMRVFMGMRLASMLVLVSMGMGVFVGMKMFVFMFFFHGIPPFMGVPFM